MLGRRDHRVHRVSQDCLEILANKDHREILEILVSRASEDLVVIMDSWDLPELQVRKVKVGSQVEEATMDSLVLLVILEDKVGLVELEQLELLGSVDQMAN